MKIRFSAGGMATIIAGLGLAACQADKIETPASELYNREFIKQFGAFDRSHDWMMAKRVKANVDPSMTAGASVVEIFNSMPGSADCRIAARYTASTREFEFDFPKEAKEAYVQIRDEEGITTFAGYMPVVDGVLNISRRNSSRATASVSLIDLSGSKAIGTFPVDKSYNQSFWQSYNGGQLWENRIAPTEIDTEKTTSLFNGSETLSDWGTGEVSLDKTKFENLPSDRLEITVTYGFTEGYTGDTPQWALKCMNGDWPILNACENGNVINEWNTVLEPSPKTFTLESNDVTNAKLYGLAIQGRGITVTDVSVRQLTPSKTDNSQRASLSDAFKFYGMTTGSTDWQSFKNGSWLKGTPSTEEGRKITDLIPIIGKDGVFNEGIKEINGQWNCNLHQYADRLQPAAGVEYVVKEKSTISLEYFYGATANYNSFGYFYYNAGESQEEIMKRPKFLLMYDACPGSNLGFQTSEGGEYSSFTPYVPSDALDGMYVPGGTDWDAWKTLPNQVISQESDGYSGYDARVRSTNYDLVYYEFDANGNVTKADYEFPAGTHVAFFVVTGGRYRFDREGTSTKLIDNEVVTFSLPWMNKLIGNTANDGHSHYKKDQGGWQSDEVDQAEGDDPKLAFVTYRWNGQYVLGTEDAGTYGDHDMNDILFFVNGSIVPETPTEELDKKGYTWQSWILAAEDLGGAHDYDFNDVVIGLSHFSTNIESNGTTTTEGSDYFTVTPLAAGGTLPVYLKYNGQYLDPDAESGLSNNKVEFHSLFGVSSNTVHNAGSFAGPGKKIRVKCDRNFSLAEFIGHTKTGESGHGFTIEVDGVQGALNNISFTAGEEAPQILLFEGVWRWPKESTPIQTAYPHFTQWAQNSKLMEWTKSYESGAVVYHGWRPSEDMPDDNQ